MIIRTCWWQAVTRGGILLAWKSREVTITDPLFSTNAITAKVCTPTATATPWWLTVVYEPQEDADKIAFLREIRDIRADCDGPWMLCGDFNMISAEDKNNGNLDRRMMGCFRRLINDLALKEVYLNGRRYTWSNEQSPPTLVRLDRVLCTTSWEELHCHSHLRCVASVVSDHSPLLLDCPPLPSTHRQFHFKEFWTRMTGFQEVVAATWNSVTTDEPFQRVAIRLRTMARMLTSWSACTVSNVRHKMAISRDLILRYDKAQESRLLSPHEDWLRKEIKRAYIGLASLERTMARQRARLAFLPSTITNAPTGSRKTGSMASP
jgi:hypothetical protein